MLAQLVIIEVMRYLFILLFIIFFICYQSATFDLQAEVVFLNVGQGDSFCLRTPTGKIILIDGGPDWSTLYGLGRYLGFKNKKIDYLILSHGHADHLSALPEVVNRYEVQKVFLPARLTGDIGQALLLELQNEQVMVEYPQNNFCLSLEANCRLCLFVPGSKFVSSQDENDLSLAIHFDCAGLKVAAAGDASQARERELISFNYDLSAQVLKASHHGSKSSSAAEFLEAVKPQLMLISVGKNNYGHPAYQVINRAEQSGIDIWRTDEGGDVLFYSNNSQLYWKKPW